MTQVLKEVQQILIVALCVLVRMVEQERIKPSLEVLKLLALFTAYCQAVHELQMVMRLTVMLYTNPPPEFYLDVMRMITNSRLHHAKDAPPDQQRHETGRFRGAENAAIDDTPLRLPAYVRMAARCDACSYALSGADVLSSYAMQELGMPAAVRCPACGSETQPILLVKTRADLPPEHHKVVPPSILYQIFAASCQPDTTSSKGPNAVDQWEVDVLADFRGAKNYRWQFWNIFWYFVSSPSSLPYGFLLSEAEEQLTQLDPSRKYRVNCRPFEPWWVALPGVRMSSDVVEGDDAMTVGAAACDAVDPRLVREHSQRIVRDIRRWHPADETSQRPQLEPTQAASPPERVLARAAKVFLTEREKARSMAKQRWSGKSIFFRQSLRSGLYPIACALGLGTWYTALYEQSFDILFGSRDGGLALDRPPSQIHSDHARAVHAIFASRTTGAGGAGSATASSQWDKALKVVAAQFYSSRLTRGGSMCVPLRPAWRSLCRGGVFDRERWCPSLAPGSALLIFRLRVSYSGLVESRESLDAFSGALLDDVSQAANIDLEKFSLRLVELAPGTLTSVAIEPRRLLGAISTPTRSRAATPVPSAPGSAGGSPRHQPVPPAKNPGPQSVWAAALAVVSQAADANSEFRDASKRSYSCRIMGHVRAYKLRGPEDEMQVSPGGAYGITHTHGIQHPFGSDWSLPSAKRVPLATNSNAHGDIQSPTDAAFEGAAYVDAVRMMCELTAARETELFVENKKAGKAPAVAGAVATRERSPSNHHFKSRRALVTMAGNEDQGATSDVNASGNDNGGAAGALDMQRVPHARLCALLRRMKGGISGLLRAMGSLKILANLESRGRLHPWHFARNPALTANPGILLVRVVENQRKVGSASVAVAAGKNSSFPPRFVSRASLSLGAGLTPPSRSRMPSRRASSIHKIDDEDADEKISPEKISLISGKLATTYEAVPEVLAPAPDAHDLDFSRAALRPRTDPAPFTNELGGPLSLDCLESMKPPQGMHWASGKGGDSKNSNNWTPLLLGGSNGSTAAESGWLYAQSFDDEPHADATSLDTVRKRVLVRVAIRDGSDAANDTEKITFFRLFERQRLYADIGWSARLLPEEGFPWSRDSQGQTMAAIGVSGYCRPNPGFEFVPGCEWTLASAAAKDRGRQETARDADPDGWVESDRDRTRVRVWIRPVRMARPGSLSTCAKLPCREKHRLFDRRRTGAPLKTRRGDIQSTLSAGALGVSSHSTSVRSMRGHAQTEVAQSQSCRAAPSPLGDGASAMGAAAGLRAGADTAWETVYPLTRVPHLSDPRREVMVLPLTERECAALLSAEGLRDASVALRAAVSARAGIDRSQVSLSALVALARMGCTLMSAEERDAAVARAAENFSYSALAQQCLLADLREMVQKQLTAGLQAVHAAFKKEVAQGSK